MLSGIHLENNLKQRVLAGRAHHEKGEYKQASRIFRSAAAKRNVEAQYCLAFMYEKGEGVNQNTEKAMRIYRSAADKGYAEAQYNLACMYEEGRGVEKDAKEAAQLFRLAAEQGHSDAQYNLALLHRNGEGVQRDNKEAIRLYHLAAEQGNPDAQYNLAMMYREGTEDIERNDKEATRLLRLAAAQGDADAQELLDYDEETARIRRLTTETMAKIMAETTKNETLVASDSTLFGKNNKKRKAPSSKDMMKETIDTTPQMKKIYQPGSSF